jgi:hypothetical protein
MADEVAATVFTGGCYCGAVRFKYEYTEATKPRMSGFCHCNNCRRLNSSDMVHLVGVPPKSFSITSGEDKIKAGDYFFVAIIST